METICFLIACALAMLGPDAGTRSAIVQAATEHGIDPDVALAIAERESGFNPNARSSKTIRGIFQMRGDLRHQYGAGDATDPYAQAKGWGAFFKDNKAEMARVLGRDPTDAEGYLGHHFGGVRAARMMTMDPATPVDQVFTREERRLNPHLDKAGTVGNLNDTVLADISRRSGRYGAVPDYSEAGTPVIGLGTPTGTDNGPATPLATAPATSAPDFSSFGVAAEQPSVQPTAAPDFSNLGKPA